jgi:hypothetical protein
MTNTNPTDKRAQVIAGLRALADLAERLPELPISYLNSTALWGDDAENGKELDGYVEMLRDGGIEFTDDTSSEKRNVVVKLAGLTYRIYFTLDAVRKRWVAEFSYSDNIQVDEPAEVEPTTVGAR